MIKYISFVQTCAFWIDKGNLHAFNNEDQVYTQDSDEWMNSENLNDVIQDMNASLWEEEEIWLQHNVIKSLFDICSSFEPSRYIHEKSLGFNKLIYCNRTAKNWFFKAKK